MTLDEQRMAEKVNGAQDTIDAAALDLAARVRSLDRQVLLLTLALSGLVVCIFALNHELKAVKK